MSADKYVLSLAEGVLKACGSADPVRATPNQMENRAHFPTAKENHTAPSVKAINVGAFRKYAILYQRSVEADYAERGYMFIPFFSDGHLIYANNNGQASYVHGVSIPNTNDPRFFIPFDAPLINEIVFGDSDGSLTDRIRVATYLVCIFRNTVGRIGAGNSVFSDLVGVLRALVSQCGDESASDASECANGSQNSVEHIHHSSGDCEAQARELAAKVVWRRKVIARAREIIKQSSPQNS